jgi:hypothetical protein
MAINEEFLDKLAEYACWDLNSSGLRLPVVLSGTIAALSADAGVPEIAVKREIMARVRDIRTRYGRTAADRTPRPAQRTWNS